MDEKKPFSLKKRLLSFRYAFKGIAHLVIREHNFRIHLIAMVLVIAAGLILGLSSAEWLVIIITIGMVLITETLNSVVEKLCDIIAPGEDTRIKIIKDMMAAAVLIAAIISVVIGLIIFIPHILACIL